MSPMRRVFSANCGRGRAAGRCRSRATMPGRTTTRRRNAMSVPSSGTWLPPALAHGRRTRKHFVTLDRLRSVLPMTGPGQFLFAYGVYLMSLYGVLRTGVSGLTAQASKLGTVGDNIANANTTGCKRSSTEFSSLVVGGGTKQHNPGGVTSTVRNAISQQGHLLPTMSSTDLAVEGNGFFIVSNGAGTPFLTRAGSFVPDGAGKLVNAGGFKLMGLPLSEGGAGTIANGFSGLQEVNITAAQLEASPSAEGRLFANLPSNADDVAGDLPSDNDANSGFTAKTSLLAFDNLGNEVLLDIY